MILLFAFAAALSSAHATHLKDATLSARRLTQCMAYLGVKADQPFAADVIELSDDLRREIGTSVKRAVALFGVEDGAETEVHLLPVASATLNQLKVRAMKFELPRVQSLALPIPPPPTPGGPAYRCIGRVSATYRAPEIVRQRFDVRSATPGMVVRTGGQTYLVVGREPDRTAGPERRRERWASAWLIPLPGDARPGDAVAAEPVRLEAAGEKLRLASQDHPGRINWIGRAVSNLEFDAEAPSAGPVRGTLFKLQIGPRLKRWFEIKEFR